MGAAMRVGCIDFREPIARPLRVEALLKYPRLEGVLRVRECGDSLWPLRNSDIINDKPIVSYLRKRAIVETDTKLVIEHQSTRCCQTSNVEHLMREAQGCEIEIVDLRPGGAAIITDRHAPIRIVSRSARPEVQHSIGLP